MISTVIIILIIILFIIIGAHRGAARTLLNFAAMIAASILSRVLSNMIAQAVYDAFIKPGVISSLEETIQRNGAEYAAQNSIDALPGGLQGVLRFFTKMLGVTTGDLQGRLMINGSQTGELARAIEQPLGSMAVFLLAVVFSMVLFLLLWIIFKLIIRVVAPLFELPGIRTLNRVFGGFVGALEGAVMAVFLCNVLYLLMSCINPVAAENKTVFGELFNMLIIFK